MATPLEINTNPLFGDLRPLDPWRPRFCRESSIRACADHINRPHEDYPKRIEATALAIGDVMAEYPHTITTELLQRVHAQVFADAAHAGQLRRIMVTVGAFIPPPPDLLPRLMQNLEMAYATTDLDTGTLASWYTDFETIHPFQDGNGRVGGIIIAALNRRNDRSYWMAPGQ